MAFIPRFSYRLRAKASTGARCFAPDISAVPIWPAITLPSAGGARFFLQTPAWADLRPGVALRALVGGGGSLMHVEHLRQPVRTAIIGRSFARAIPAPRGRSFSTASICRRKLGRASGRERGCEYV